MMTFSYLIMGVLEQGAMQKGGFLKDGVKRVVIYFCCGTLWVFYIIILSISVTF